MMPAPAISVVVPVLDGMPWLEDQLGAIAAQSASVAFDIVVVDNGSSDGSQELVRRWADRDPRFRLVDASATPGPAAARNAGARATDAIHLAFCDADDIVAPGWLEACRHSLERNDVVAGALDRGSLNGRPGVPAPPAMAQLGFLPAGLGANLAVRAAAFWSVGGFDESMLVGEDVDLCWRMQLAGFRFGVAPAAVVAKRDRQSACDVLTAGYRYGKSGVTLYRRYRGAGARRDVAGALRSWARLGADIPTLVVKRRRLPWLQGLGMRAGRLSGSARQGAFFP